MTFKLYLTKCPLHFVEISVNYCRLVLFYMASVGTALIEACKKRIVARRSRRRKDNIKVDLNEA